MGAGSPLVMLGRFFDSLPQFLQPIEFRVIQSADELRASAHLVYREYLMRGYLHPNDSQMKLSLYHALPTTTTFVARHRTAGIIGTVALVEDSPLGLPMDEAYKAELDGLRRDGLRLAEASMLALDSRVFGRSVFTLFHAKKLLLTLQLFKVLFDYLRSSILVDELVACFNPKHQILYDFLRLQPLGDLKTYTGANGNPAVARHLNVLETERNAKAAAPYRLFYGTPPSAKPFTKKLKLSLEDLRQLFTIETPIFASASPSELAYIRSCYPMYAFEQILQKTPASLPH